MAGGKSRERQKHLTLNGQNGAVEPETRFRSLYNLAAGAPDPEEREKWLSLLTADGQKNPARVREPAYLYGVAAYARTLAPYEALALLDTPEPEAAPGIAPELEAIWELEILRRRGELWTLDRTVAETWLLLGRYPQDNRLYQWAAWYFSRQRRYGELDVLIKTAGYRDIQGPWLDLIAGLRDMETGSLDRAEERLRAMTLDPANRAVWQAEANLGLILERRHAPFPALEHYETAAARMPATPAQDKRNASRLQLRIAGCLRSLGRTEDCRRALTYSLDLNPDNLAARLELRRLEDQ